MAEEGVEPSKPRKKRTKPKKSAEEEIPLDDVPPASAKLRVDQILQQVVSQSTKDATDVKKKKKKKEKNEDDDVLESLRKGEGIEGLHKETDDAILANTYDPDDSKSEKSNKQRQRRKDRNKNKNTEDDKRNVSEEGTEVKTTPRKKKKPKSKEEFIEDEVERELGLITETNEAAVKKKTKSPKKAVEETADLGDEEKPKKKPRKKQTTEIQQEQEEEAEKNEEEEVKTKTKKKKKKDKEEEKIEEEVEEEAVKKSEEEEPKAKPRKKKKKKEEEEEGKEEEEEEAKKEEEETEETAKDTKKKKKKKKQKGGEAEPAPEEEEEIPDIEDQGAVMAVMIHRTDKLKNDFRILHPVIRVHVVNEETGQYLAKQHQDRAVTSYFETSNEKVKFILPMMTQPFDFKERRSILPIWEELLMFNENFNYFVQARPKVLLLFELLDFVSMNAAREQFSKQKEDGGWYRIAWAFLKVVGKNEKVNVGHKVRLQLYNPGGSSGKKQQGQPDVYHWWQSNQRVPYPSTLYVTLKSIEPPDEVMGATRSMFATQKELGRLTYKELKSNTWTGRDKGLQSGRTVTTWTRLLGQLCRVPNALNLTLTAGKKGCYVIKFSNDGRSLACACQNGTDYPILIYEIPAGTLKGQFQGHFGIVYSLCWSRTDTQLMSASSDGTVRIWDLHRLGENQTKLLPHPGFVYTAEFHPRVDSIVVSGGYDEVIRVWDLSIPEEHGMLQQEMEEHHGHINSVCFDPDDGQKMYSADSTGVIFIWNVFVTEQASRKHFMRDWTKYQEIRDPELKDTPINLIRMHHSGRRLLVHARNNAIFMFDLRVQRVMQKYFGAENLKEKIHSTITPCGSFVFSGSEDGKVYAWNVDTGDQVAVFTQLNYNAPVTDVNYHPRDHMLAICSLGNNHPVYVYKYDPMIAQADVSSPRPMSPVETTDIEDFENAQTAALKETEPLSARSQVLSKEEFDAQEKARYHRVMRKLDTATLQMSQMPGMVVPDQYLSPRMDTIGRTGVQSTWRMPMEASYSLTPRSSGFHPGVLSPHAPTGSGELLTHQLTSQRGYLRSSDGDWRPAFSEVGRHGQRSQSPTYYGRPPHLSLNTSLGKPQFTFESPAGKTVKFKEVVAIYDYRAQRSDELTLYKGDVIKVLYKDNENWWMGETLDGQQGFFPANYVTDDDPDLLQRGRRGSRASTASSSGTVTAVKTKNGELKFVSTGEESDSEQTKTKKKHTVEFSDKTSSDDSPSGKHPTSKDRRSSIDKLLEEYESVA